MPTISMGNTIAGKMEQVALSTDYPLNDSQNLIFAYSSSILLWLWTLTNMQEAFAVWLLHYKWVNLCKIHASAYM